ncbi:LytTR family DNA-binding domain-containing protein [Paenibacillus koleovorans]|uniref:LytTR family DNA-binding domain-containing protein n=1 Tax=Paenibacillus koleovorans TaxID=121608 RepID=UPI000FD73711|nr:LytTR family DNA-binding domain-containing protein [Paenibacillus koleovorans]
MKFAVTRHPLHDPELLVLDADDVLYMEVEERTVVFHTADDKFYLVDTLSELAKRMGALGFQKLDRINLVNMNKIKQFDDKQCKVFFDEPAAEGTKNTTVSFTNKNMMIDLVQKSNSNFKN